MSGEDKRESLRAYRPSVYVNGRKLKSVAGDAGLAPGFKTAWRYRAADGQGAYMAVCECEPINVLASNG